ncbi:MAG: MFS transporter [Actinobacteria bacterium]|nr:MFS transporter [Actinomycetota bacterium]
MRAYRELLRLPGAWWLICGALPGRIAFSMCSLSIFFRVDHVTDSLSAAGIAVGAFGLTSSLTAGWRGRLVDRYGQTRPLMIFVPAYAISMVVLGIFSHDAYTSTVLAALAGLACPPFNMSIRPLWQQLAGPERSRAAYALDSALMNAAQLAGPALATFIALQISTTTALLVNGLCMGLGGSILLSSPLSRKWVPEPRRSGEPGLFKSPAIRFLALEGAAMGVAMGMISIAIPASTKLAGQQWITGWLFSASALGAVLAGMAVGARVKNYPPVRGLVVTQSIFAGLCLLLPFTHPGWPLLLLMFASGLTNGPAHVFYMETIDAVRPRGTAVSAMAALWTIEGSVGAGASGLTGTIIQMSSPSFALMICAVFCLVSPVMMYVGSRGVLRAAAAPPGRTITELAPEAPTSEAITQAVTP